MRERKGRIRNGHNKWLDGNGRKEGERLVYECVPASSLAEATAGEGD